MSRARQAGAAVPAQPFFSTPQQRLALARERYFEQGIRPSGLVSESVIQSWSRCLQARRDPREAIAFNPVTVSRVQSALTRSRLLLETAAPDLNQLESILAGTACTVLLTDPQGVVVHAAWAGQSHDEVLLPLARRIGVCLAEESIGTNAPGVTARTGQASLVLGGEHFFGCVQVMHCAAAPIRDVHGQVAAVLDVSSESRPFGFDAAAVVGLYATAIENRLLCAQSREHLVVHLQTSPGLLGTPMEGLVGVGPDARLAWANGAAARLLGIAPSATPLRAEDVFGCKISSLAARSREPGAAPFCLPSGLTVWLQVHLQSPDGARQVFSLHDGASRTAGTGAAAASAAQRSERPAATAATLREADRHLVVQTVRDCGGNVSCAARRLGVSRGLVYRHLKQARQA